MKTQPGNPGFTLVEILLALTMMVIILGTVYAAYAAMSASVSRCRAKVAVDQEARTLLQMVAREIRCGLVPADRERDGPSSEERGRKIVHREENRPYFLGQRNAANGELLRLVTIGGITRPDEVAGIPRLIAYRFDPSSRTILRGDVRFVEGHEALDDEENWLPVAGNVEAVTLKYFDGAEWQDEWDSNRTNTFPGAVSIQLEMETERAGRAVFSTAARITRCSGERRVSLVVRPKPGRPPSLRLREKK